MLSRCNRPVRRPRGRGAFWLNVGLLAVVWQATELIGWLVHGIDVGETTPQLVATGYDQLKLALAQDTVFSRWLGALLLVGLVGVVTVAVAVPPRNLYGVEADDEMSAETQARLLNRPPGC